MSRRLFVNAAGVDDRFVNNRHSHVLGGDVLTNMSFWRDLRMAPCLALASMKKQSRWI
jgi:hypothetical protein